MNLTKERKVIEEWISKWSEEGSGWNNLDIDSSTYWKKRDTVGSLEDYYFSNITEIQEELHNLWKNDRQFKELEEVLSVAILKARKRTKEETPIELVDYVYIF